MKIIEPKGYMVAAAAIVLIAGVWFWPVLRRVPAASTSAEEEPVQVIRKPAVAGRFYPGDRDELSSLVDRLLTEAAPQALPGKVRAIVVPHAGYVYSGGVAAVGYKTLDRNLRRFFILASNHSPGTPSFRFSVSRHTHYQTPLGNVSVSPVARTLLEVSGFSFVPAAHTAHVVEVQLPFLERIYGEDFEIVPIITGTPRSQDLDAAAEVLSAQLDPETLIVVSSDLSHYHPYEKASVLDRSCIKALAAADIELAASCEACGLDAVMILLRIARKRGWRGEVLEYKNSGDTSGDKRSVVGYAAIAYFEQEEKQEKTLSAGDRQLLITLSRDTLEAAVRGIAAVGKETDSIPPHLLERQGCFVTLKKKGDLRGCIGSLEAREPLYRCVIQNTVNAALHDYRFSPVSEKELADIDLEISVLSVPRPIEYSSKEGLLASLAPLRTGVVLQRGSSGATYLPQVWEQLPGKEAFLSSLCKKGGMESECWMDSRTTVFTYEAFVFGEHG